MAQLDFQINVGGNAGEAVGSLKKQLREAQAEVGALADKFGATSAEAVKAAKRAAELKDRIGDAKALTDSFNPDQKFKALTSSLSGVAGGFAAVQGAIGLFGVESKEVEKTLLKVQSAMALSQGLEAVGNSIDSFKNLGSVIKDVGSKAFGSLRAGIISTGIGALVIGLGLLIANFDAVKKYILNLIPGLGKVADYIGNLVNKITDFVGITSEAGRATAKLLKENDAAIKASERNLELNGDKYDEYTQRKIKANDEFKKRQNEFLKDETLSESDKIKFIQQARERANRDILASDDDRAAKQKEANLKAYEEQQKLLKERRDKEKAEEEEYQKQNKENADRRKDDLRKGDEEIAKAKADQKEEEKKGEEDLLGRLTDRGNASIKIAEDVVKTNQNIGQSKIALSDLEKQKTQEQTNMAMQSLDILSGMVDKNSIAGKAIAVAQAIINTYQGASKAIAQGGTFGPILAGVTIAAGLLNVKKIISTKIPSAKGGGDVGGGGSAPSISSAAPMQPQIPQAATTNLSSSTINALGNQAIKAYVVETDVTSNQQRVKAIQQRARFD
jgi:hypothetical protein